MNISNFIEELKRRNVIKVATAYAIAGWLIIQIATSVFPAFEFPSWTTQFVIILVAIGLPLSLIFAWAFELTPEGIRKSKEVDITESVTSRTGKKLNGLIIGVLAFAVVFLLVERVFFAKASILEDASKVANIETASIAVLPFVNMSSDAENEYFSDGLSEELLNALAKIQDMRVAGRTSSFKFKGQNENLSLIADELGVAHILEGSVRKAGNRVRITAQLIQADNGYHLWSETYERELTTEDIFNIQQEITGHVVDELKIRLLPEEEVLLAERPTENLEAYETYLKATQKELTLKPTDLEEAISLYQRAVELDPGFSEAHARKAIAYVMLYGNGNISIEYTREKMKESIDRALLSDINSGRVYQALGFYYNLNGEDDKADEAITKAAEMLPNDALVMTSYAQMNNDRYRDKANVERINKAYELDPNHPFVANEYAEYLYWIDQFEESITLLDKIIAAYPDYTKPYETKISQILDAPYGEIDEAFKIAYSLYQKHPLDVNAIVSLTGITSSLRLNGITRDLIKKMRTELPNNPGVIEAERFLYFSTQDTAGIAKLRREIISTFNLADDDVRYFKLVNSYLAGDYERGLKILEEQNPELNNEVQNANAKDLPWPAYALFLNKSGDKNRSLYFANLFCDREDKNMEPLPDETYKVNDNWIRLSCQILKEDFDAAEKTLRDLHFNQKSKANWDYFNTLTLARQIIFEESIFDSLIADIDEDIMRMRGNVVDYLKAEGEWKEEWEEENYK